MRRKLNFFAALAILLGVPLALGAQDVPPPKGEVVDSIIARVNDAIITKHQYEQAQKALKEEIKQDCPSCTAAQREDRYEKEKKNVLRDLIDQELLVQRAKDDGINVDAQVVLQLNSVREKYHLASMDALQRAVEASGMNWDDYKSSIKRQLMTQKLIQQDVGGTIQIDHKAVEEYYQAHKSEFNRPEEVVIREIILSTKGKTPAQDAEIQKKADMIRKRILNGDDFGQLAKLYSDGPTAKEQGELGTFTRGQLAKPIEDAVFKLQRHQMTPVMKLSNGYAIFQVEQHYDAGVQPVDKVEPEIEQAIYMKKIGPAMRSFLKVLRQQSYIKLKPGYVDSAAVAETPIEEVVPGVNDSSGKKGKKKKKGGE